MDNINEGTYHPEQSEGSQINMILKSLTTGKIICNDLKLCQSFTDRTFGLLISKNPRSLLFKTRFGIHTFFLKEPIDILILDNQMKIVKLKQDLRPNKLFFWNPMHDQIIELEAGTIKKFNLKINTILEIN